MTVLLEATVAVAAWHRGCNPDAADVRLYVRDGEVPQRPTQPAAGARFVTPSRIFVAGGGFFSASLTAQYTRLIAATGVNDEVELRPQGVNRAPTMTPTFPVKLYSTAGAT